MKRGMEEKGEKKAFVWLSLRISFWIMIGLYLISLIAILINPDLYLSYLTLWVVLGIIQTISIFFTFVVSIIHLGKYKKKAFAIVALVLSSILLLLFLFGILIGSLIGVNQLSA